MISYKLNDHLDSNVIEFLNKNEEILHLLRDWLILINYTGERSISRTICDEVTGRIKGNQVIEISTLYYDYSFLIASAYKAFEGYLYLIAESLGFKKESHEIRNIGNLYDSDKIQKIKEDIITETRKKIDKGDKEGLEIIDGLRRALRHYRHNPAHFGGSIDRFQKAKNYGSMIFTIINDSTKCFLDKGLIAS
jgi:hypothetical protein